MLHRTVTFDRHQLPATMTSADLTCIEQQLSIRLPAMYKAWAVRLPGVNEETETWHWAFNDPVNLVEINQTLVREGCQGEPWDTGLYCIGEADGNHYFIDLANADSSVYYTNHDDGPYYQSGQWEECRYASAGDFFSGG